MLCQIPSLRLTYTPIGQCSFVQQRIQRNISVCFIRMRFSLTAATHQKIQNLLQSCDRRDHPQVTEWQPSCLPLPHAITRYHSYHSYDKERRPRTNVEPTMLPAALSDNTAYTHQHKTCLLFSLVVWLRTAKKRNNVFSTANEYTYNYVAYRDTRNNVQGRIHG